MAENSEVLAGYKSLGYERVGDHSVFGSTYKLKKPVLLFKQ